MITNKEYYKKVILDLADEQASQNLAIQLANCLVSPLVIAFSGDLGAGKTTIVRAMLQHLGVECAIKSPTFSLVESYFCANIVIHHFDLYRIEYEDELDYLGFRDYFTNNSICCIEWAENAGASLPNIDVHFKLSVKGIGRVIDMTAFSDNGKIILERLTGEL